MTNKWGYLREHSEEASKLRKNPNNKLHKTGLNEYLKVIFPNRNFVHDTKVEGVDGRKRPDYYSNEPTKLIVEFNGLPHYTKPDIILRDKIKQKLFEDNGYKVVMIPYFIQLTNKAVKTLFGVDVKEPLFDENIPSLFVSDGCTPAFLCPEGIKRMAEDFLKFPEQYEVNMKQMKKEMEMLDKNGNKKYDPMLFGIDLLEKEYNSFKGGC